MCVECVSYVFFFFFKQKKAYELLRSLVGSAMCIRASYWRLGLPLEIVVTLVSVPAILFFWG
mgnify:CR=1 FL=1